MNREGMNAVVSHREYNRKVFEAFLEAHPSLAERVRDIEYPEERDRADVVALFENQDRTEWQLGEWLESGQMMTNRQREQLEEAIVMAVGNERTKEPQHIRTCMLSPKDGVRFDGRDAETFRREMMELIEEVDRRWPDNRSWQTPQGLRLATFDGYPILGKYLAGVYFDPRVVAGEPREWPPGPPWVFLEAWGGTTLGWRWVL